MKTLSKPLNNKYLSIEDNLFKQELNKWFNPDQKYKLTVSEFNYPRFTNGFKSAHLLIQVS